MLLSNFDIVTFLIILPSIIVAFTVHEFFHAYASFKLGDYTAKEDGRLTLNPLKHIDLYGFIFLLITGFGWAKPVIVNPNYYKNPTRDTALVALAGPLSNLGLCLIGILLNILFKNTNIYLEIFCSYFWMINLGLCIFNLLPIPPLDGSKVLGLFLKGETYKGYLNHQFLGFILLLVIIFFDVFSMIMDPIINFIFGIIYTL